MSGDTKKKTGKGGLNTPEGFLNDANSIIANAGTVPGATSTAASTTTPGVTSSDSSDVITFSLPHQSAAFDVPADLTSKSASGDTEISFNNWMESIRSLEGPMGQEDLKNLQAQLKAAGFIKTANYVPTGNLDSTTLTAWKDFGLSLVGAPAGVSASTILAMGKNAGTTLTELQKIESDINSARGKAASITNSNVTLTDPNEIAQKFQTAMESIGAGPPSKELTQQFVNAFHGAEVSATQNEVDAEKQNYAAGVSNLQTAFNDYNAGDTAAGANALQDIGPGGAIVGPTEIATKASPDLDAEAIAQVKADDPAQYYANSTSFAYGVLQRMLSGDMSQPTTPSSPTSLASTGGILTTPLTAAA